MGRDSRPIGLLAAGLALLAASAAKADPQDWSGEVGAGSDVISSKEITKTGGRPGAWGSLQRQIGDGFLGTAALSDRSHPGDWAELQLYGGLKQKALGWDWRLTGYYKHFAGARLPRDRDMAEFRLEASREFGMTSTRLRYEYTPDNAGFSRSGTWVEAWGGFSLRPGTQLGAALGRREQVLGVDYTAWNVGVKQALRKPMSLYVRWYDTDAHRFGRDYTGRLVAALVASF